MQKFEARNKNIQNFSNTLLLEAQRLSMSYSKQFMQIQTSQFPLQQTDQKTAEEQVQGAQTCSMLKFIYMSTCRIHTHMYIHASTNDLEAHTAKRHALRVCTEAHSASRPNEQQLLPRPPNISRHCYANRSAPSYNRHSCCFETAHSYYTEPSTSLLRGGGVKA